MRRQQPSARSASDLGKDHCWHLGWPETALSCVLWRGLRPARGFESPGCTPTAVAADIALCQACVGPETPLPDWHLDLPPGVDSMAREEVYRLQARVDVLEQVRLAWEWVLPVSTDSSL